MPRALKDDDRVSVRQRAASRSPAKPPSKAQLRERALRVAVGRLDEIARVLAPRVAAGDLEAAKLSADVTNRLTVLVAGDVVPRAELRNVLRRHRARTRERYQVIGRMIGDQLVGMIAEPAREGFLETVARELQNLEGRWSVEDELEDARLEAVE